MKFKDAIYGDIHLPEELLQLTQSPIVQRLKKVHQGGAAFLVYPHITTTRFEHSIGVAYLVSKLGGTLKDVVIGLLHDISHTAFSHLADYIFSQRNEDFHEEYFYKFLKHSDISNSLKTIGLDYKQIFNDRCVLVNEDLPSLSCDRIDYALRDGFYWGLVSKEEAFEVVENVKFNGSNIYFESIEKAETFSRLFSDINTDYFSDPKVLWASEKLSLILQEALKTEFITKNDLFLDDFQLLKKIQVKFNNELEDIKNLKDFSSTQTHLKTKKRLIDPHVFSKLGICKLSEVNSSHSNV